MIAGYARSSSVQQSLEIQLRQLKEAGCERIWSEKYTGTTMDGRAELQDALAFLREGDVLIVARLDRLARSTKDALTILETLERRKVGFRCLHQQIDTTTSMGKMIVTIMAAVAEFETNLRMERQREGVDKARADGKYDGRGRLFDRDKMMRMKRAGKSAKQIAERLGCSQAHVYRMIPGQFGELPSHLRSALDARKAEALARATPEKPPQGDHRAAA